MRGTKPRGIQPLSQSFMVRYQEIAKWHSDGAEAARFRVALKRKARARAKEDGIVTYIVEEHDDGREVTLFQANPNGTSSEPRKRHRGET